MNISTPSGYPLDTARFTAQSDLTATGIVEPVPVWTVTDDGKRRPSDVQATNDDGVPEWFVHVTWLTEDWGRPVERSAAVRVPSRTKPPVRRHHRVAFVDLTLSVKLNKAGRLVESFTASGIRPEAAEKAA